MSVDTNDGTLSVAVDTSGRNTYNFAERAAYIAHVRSQLRLADNEPTPGGPWTVEIMPTWRCNANCTHCSYRYANKAAIERARTISPGNLLSLVDLPRDTVFKLLEDLKSGGMTRGTYWAGGGEPMVWPHIVEALGFASTFAQNFVQTNGIRLDKLTKDPRNLQSVNLLSISCSGDTRELFHDTEQVDKFDRVVENIRNIIALREQYNPDLVINVKLLVNRKNYMFTPRMVKFFESLGVDTVGLRLVQDYNYGDGKGQQSVELQFQEKAELFHMLSTDYSSHPLLTRFATTLMQQTKPVQRTRACYNAVHSHFAAIDPDGEVYLGNPEIDMKNLSIGNIRTNSWSHIWSSSKHREVIEQMNRTERDSTCPIDLCRHANANLGAEEFIDGVRAAPKLADIDPRYSSFM